MISKGTQKQLDYIRNKQLTDLLTAGCAWVFVVAFALALWTGAILIVLKIFGLI
jgi:hypothetical protein